MLDWFFVIPDCYARLKPMDKRSVAFFPLSMLIYLVTHDAIILLFCAGGPFLLLSAASDSSHPKYDGELHRRASIFFWSLVEFVGFISLATTPDEWNGTFWDWVDVSVSASIATIPLAILALDLRRPAWWLKRRRWLPPIPPARRIRGANSLPALPRQPGTPR